MGQEVRDIDEPEECSEMIFPVRSEESIIQNFQFLLRTLLMCFPLPIPIVY